MRAFWTCFLAASLLAAVGCGGGGSSSGKNDCGDVAKKVVTCVNSLQPGTLNDADKAQIQALCEAQDCTGGDKQGAIDCVVGLSCTANIQADAAACVSQNGCTMPSM